MNYKLPNLKTMFSNLTHKSFSILKNSFHNISIFIKDKIKSFFIFDKEINKEYFQFCVSFYLLSEKLIPNIQYSIISFINSNLYDQMVEVLNNKDKTRFLIIILKYLSSNLPIDGIFKIASFIMLLFLIFSMTKRLKDLNIKNFIMLINPIQWIFCLFKKGRQKSSHMSYRIISLVILILVSSWYFIPITMNARLLNMEIEERNPYTAIKKNTLLHGAVARNSIRYSKLFIRLGARVNIMNESNMTPMHLAIFNGNVEVAKLLLKSNLDLNLENALLFDKSSITNNYLHLIANIRQPNAKELLELFLKYKVDVNSTDHLGRTALYFSAETYQPDLIKLLIENGAKINILDNNKDNALHGLLKICKKHIKEYNADIIKGIKILLKHEVSINEKNIYGITPIELAKKKCSKRIVSLLNNQVLKK